MSQRKTIPQYRIPSINMNILIFLCMFKYRMSKTKRSKITVFYKKKKGGKLNYSSTLKTALEKKTEFKIGQD